MPPAVGQFSQDAGSGTLFESPFGFVHNGGGGSSDACDVLQDEAPRTASVGNVENQEEEPRALPVQAGPAASKCEVLARGARNDEIHAVAPSCAVEGEHVRPDRRRIKGSRFHKRDKLAGGRGFPLHVANGSVLDPKMSECGADTFSEHADTGTKFDGMKGV